MKTGRLLGDAFRYDSWRVPMNIKLADWLIDMGPEGGRGGGQLLFAGTPEEMVKQQKGYSS